MINGVINIYKEAGFTSHDVVAKMRGILKQKKIGHTGTLDPAAVGVLPVCVGSATKLCDMLTDKRKEYVAELILGVTTDTQDMTGTIKSEHEVTSSEDEVRVAVMSMLGDSQQIPPMYSALKVDGKRLYELAREGKEVERKARDITIYEIEVLEMKLPVVKFRVLCSKGTYVRTICQDIGEKLGCGGAMQSLVRTKVERFSIEDAITLSKLEELRDAGKLLDVVVPVEDMFKNYPKVTVEKQFQKLIDNGNVFFADMCVGDTPKEEVRVYNEEGQFYGVFQFDPRINGYKPVKMFLER